MSAGRAFPAPLLLLACAIVGFTGPAAAQRPPTHAGSVSGRVVEEGAETPLAEALVRLTSSTRPLAGGLPEAPREAMTDNDGRYRFEGLAPGKYDVSTEKAGYAPSASPPNRLPFVLIDADKPTAELVLALPRGAVIAGRVLDANGQPRANARVTAMRRAPGTQAGRFLPIPPPSSTNDLGEFRIHSLAAGQYIVQANANTRWLPQSARSQVSPPLVLVPTYYPGTTDAETAQPMTLTAGQTLIIEIGLQHMPTYSIAGVVTDASGRPLANAGITIIAGSDPSTFFGGPPTRARTADDGSFRLDGLTGGIYFINAAVAAGAGGTTTFTYDKADEVRVVVDGDHVTGLQLVADRLQ
jgi:hypothetical protein